jgi:type IX secretion system PorP/SprF family membrane protein
MLSNSLLAQDPHYSQFYNAPLDLNPALTGIFEGQYRLGINYRDQWSSALSSTPFKTMQASADIRYHVVNNDFFAIGFKLMRDVAGEGKYAQTFAHFSGSYMKQLSGQGYGGGSDQFLIAGAQIGVGQNSLNWSQLWFGRQYDIEQELIDTSLPTGEPDLIGENGSTGYYLDASVGLVWYSVFDQNNSIYVGVALKHINTPNISLIPGLSSHLYRRWVIHAGGELALTEEVSLLPSVLFTKQGPYWQTNVGSSFRYSHQDWREVALRFGLFSRIANRYEGAAMDALIATVIFEMETWTAGLSYDITTSGFSQSNSSRGAFELSVNYIFPITHRKYNVNCPKF